MFSGIRAKIQGKSPSSSFNDLLTLNQFFDEHYFPHIKTTKRVTKDDWSIYNVHLRARIGGYKLCDLSNAILDVWVREQIVTGYQRSTINKHIFLINRMLSLARHWGFIERSKDLTNIQRLVLGDYKQRFLSVDEITRLLTHARASNHPHIYNVIKLLVLTGARNGEARSMKWQDIDRSKRIWTVPRSKNGRSRRIVLSTEAMTAIDECVANTERLNLSLDPNSYVFTNPRTQKCYNSFYASWYAIREAAELEDVRIHDLRHTYASLLVNKGVSLYEVQTLLGHSTIQMTQRYAHLQPNLLHQRADIVGGIVSGKSS